MISLFKNRASRKAAGYRIRALLTDRGITAEQIATGVGMSPGTVRNVISGCTDSPKARQRICDFLGFEIPDWNTRPQPRVRPLSDDEKTILIGVFEQLATLGEQLRSAPDDAARESIRAKAAQIFTADFVSAYRRFAQLGVGALIEAAPIIAPFNVELLRAMGVSVEPGGAGKPFRIKLSAH